MRFIPIVTAAGAVLAASPISLAVAQETEVGAIDEVVVTGTFIRRSEGFTPASPVQEIAREDFEAHAPRSVAEFFTQLPYSFNTTFGVGRGSGSTNGSGSLNLRNLGSSATLVLLNGRRVARDAVTVGNTDVNSLLPQIAIQRIDILKDGASSLYGSDAVGGVANFLTRRSFDGAEVQMMADQRDYGNTTDYRVSGLWGAQSERSGVIVALEHFRRDPFTHDTLDIIRSRPGLESQFRQNGWPMNYVLPNRDANGVLTNAATNIGDPMCAQFGNAATSGAPVNRLGVTYPGMCQQDVLIGTSANAKEERYQGYMEFHHEVNPSLKLFGEAGFQRVRVLNVETPGGGLNITGVTIPGYAPANTYRAMTSAGVPLYAQNSGVQLGFDKDGDGINDYLPARDANGRVISVGTDPNAVGANGLPVVPFWEDVMIRNGRIFGLTCNLPGDPMGKDNCRTHLDPTRSATNAQRILGGFEGEVPGLAGWRYTTSYLLAFNNEDNTTFSSSYSMPNLRASLAGYGGPGCNPVSTDPLAPSTLRPGSGNCQFFNPFGTSVTAAPGSQLANTEDIVHYITAQGWQHFQTKAQVIDFVLSGDLLTLPAGKVGVAFGGQHRKDDWTADYTEAQNAGQTDLQAPFYDRRVSQSINAVFAEVSVPLMNSEQRGTLELTGALRYENTGGPGLDTTDPKLGLLYTNPSGMLAVRGTWSTSFLAPSLYQRYRQNVQFGASVDDVLTPQNDNLSRIPALVSGNPLLEPQSSENYNLGFTLRPWDGWSFDVDYWHFTFDDQISLESANALALDVNSALDPAKVIRDPTAGVVMWNGVNVGPIVGFNLSYFNNNSLETAGFDFTINNTRDLGAFGSLSNTLMATHQSTYKLDGRDLTGGRNGRVSGASISVPWRATLRTSWALGNHSAQSLVRFTDGFANDTLPNAGTAAKLHIPKYLVWDLSYTYDLGDRFGMKSSSVALGLNNVLDKGGIWVPDGNHTLSSMYDYSGRHIWLRLKAGF